MKGYGLDVKRMRSMCSVILKACADSNIHVACTTLDGQWLPLATKSSDDQPLTLIQLQSSVWRSVCSLSREDLTSLLALLNPIMEISREMTKLVISSPLLAFHYKSIQRPSLICTDVTQEDDYMAGSTTNVCGMEDIGRLPVDALEFADDVDDQNNVFHEPVSTSQHEVDFDDLPDLSNENVNLMATDMLSDGTERHHAVDTDHGSASVATFQAILTDMKNYSNFGVRNRWQSRTTSDILNAVKNADTLHNLTVDELDVICSNTKSLQNQAGIIIKRSGWKKKDKGNALSRVIGDGTQFVTNDLVDKVYSLSELCANIVASKCDTGILPKKKQLEILCAQAVYPHERDEWDARSTVKDVNIMDEDGVILCYGSQNSGSHIQSSMRTRTSLTQSVVTVTTSW